MRLEFDSTRSDIFNHLQFAMTVSGKRSRSPAEVESIILHKILGSAGNVAPLSADLIEANLIDILGTATAANPPFPYLIGCYSRAAEEAKKVCSMKDPAVRSQIQNSIATARNLTVSYSRLYFGCPELFGRSDVTVNTSDLLSVIFSEVCSPVDGFNSGEGLTCPSGFIHDFFKDFDGEIFDKIMKDLYERLRASVERVSALGKFQKPLRALARLVGIPNCAKALVNHPRWMSTSTGVYKGGMGAGRMVERWTILGAFLHISALPDYKDIRSEPDVGHHLFSESELATCPTANFLPSFRTVSMVMNTLYDGLAEVFLSLLKNVDTRGKVLDYLAEAIEKNSARSHMQVNPTSCASGGMFVNLSAVMLRLSKPFLDTSCTKRDKIDPTYLIYNNCLGLQELTSLNTSDDVETWKKNLTSCKTKDTYSFICECFFMTARVLNLGLMKVLSDYNHLSQELADFENSLSTFKAMRDQGASVQVQIKHLENGIKVLSQESLCYKAQILKDDKLLRQALSFYKLMVVWLTGLLGGVKMSLPLKCPVQFASMPEHFVEDAMDLLKFVSRIPRALEGFLLDDFLNFIIMFMASPSYIKNPYLRAKMVEVLTCWIPYESGLSVTTPFDGHQLAHDYLVQNLLRIYVDVEFTGSHTQFYDKFMIRHNIAKLLEYLWNFPSHRNAWRKIAKEEEKGLYLNFLNFLINDSIYLMDESLNKILELKETESEMLNSVEWQRRPAAERVERTRVFRSGENIVRFDLKLANINVGMLAFTSEEIYTPFLLPEMVERVANMLNYFLLQLVGPKRKSLTVKDPEKYEFRPKRLLKQIVEIYLHLSRGDNENIFPTAISKDGRSYNDEIFTTAADILWKIGEDRSVINEFVQLGVKVKVAASEALDSEAALGEIPDEFLDPIQYTLMTDPVMLPSSKVSVDRAVIQRHLLSDTTDPFNRSHLTQEMLIPDFQLKARIDEFIRCQGKR